VKLGAAIERVASAERDLAAGLLAARRRHPDDQDIFHLTKTLADRESAHVEVLAGHASRYDAAVREDAPARADAPAGADGPAGAGRRAELPDADDPSLQLLADLRRLHLLAAGASLDWVALAQGAQAAKDTDLLATVTECHNETLQTLKWTTYRLKEAAPQALTS
jgi:hypothetical protein